MASISIAHWIRIKIHVYYIVNKTPGKRKNETYLTIPRFPSPSLEPITIYIYIYIDIPFKAILSVDLPQPLPNTIQ